MDNGGKKVVMAQMRPRERREWTKEKPRKRRLKWDKRLLRRSVPLAAAFFCLGIAAVATALFGDDVQSVMSRVTAGFEYDETLGRLQFVSSVLPESTMVFLTGNDDEQACTAILPAEVITVHAWRKDEPWIEYEGDGEISSCMSGEVMYTVKNRQNEYTVRILHADGYESVYSGLSAVRVEEGEYVHAGSAVGTVAGTAAFELRKDGLSVMPVFAN